MNQTKQERLWLVLKSIGVNPLEENCGNYMKVRNRNLYIIIAILLVALALSACGQTQGSDDSDYQPDYLVLVNGDHLISEDYVDTIHLCEIDNVDGGTYQVEERTKEAFESMQSYLKEEGVEIGVDSAYRSIEEQQELMDEFIAKYGEAYARRTVAIPRTSEHHTGLVIDLVPKVNGKWVIENEDMLKETEIFKVIHKALPQFGFILRYPLSKAAITGYDYEPWHIRYVGKEAAQEIYDNDYTLEEYLSKN